MHAVMMIVRTEVHENNDNDAYCFNRYMYGFTGVVASAIIA